MPLQNNYGRDSILCCVVLIFKICELTYAVRYAVLIITSEVIHRNKDKNPPLKHRQL
jgi:hypothetical protein